MEVAERCLLRSPSTLTEDLRVCRVGGKIAFRATSRIWRLTSDHTCAPLLAPPPEPLTELRCVAREQQALSKDLTTVFMDTFFYVFLNESEVIFS